MEVLDRILNAAIELFRQYGFKTITMDDIARRAGISKKTLYQHFANKDEVVQESVQHFHCHTLEACCGANQTAANAIDGMIQTMTLLDEMFSKINPMAMLELQRYFPKAYEFFQNKMLAQNVSLVRQNIEQGMAEGYYRDNLNADILAHYRIEVTRIFFENSTPMMGKYPPYVINRAICEHFLYGLMTPKGEKLYNKLKENYQKQAAAL